MSRRKRTQFRVSSIRPSWFWAQVEVGLGEGKRIRIPFCHKKYDKEMKKKLLDLEEGDRIYMTLEKESEVGSKWLPEEVKELNP